MKKCLIVCSSFYPAFKSGGPARSLSNLVNTLSDKVQFDIFTSDRDMGESAPFQGLNINEWKNTYANSSVFYSSPKFSILRNIKLIFRNKDYDVIYLNSFFDSRYTILFLLIASLGVFDIRKVLLAPRGEITIGAMSLKPFKKKVYLFLFKLLSLHKKITFHFTSKEEATEALHFLGKVKYKLAPNMHGELPKYKEKDKEVNLLNVIFLSRISPKKNLITIIETLCNIKVGTVNFTIAGVIDDRLYWDKCRSLLKKLPSNINVNILGPIDREQVIVELNQSHVFFLPTLNENYGHAIVEAMMHSNVVMLSDQTPWSKVSNFGGYIGEVYDLKFYAQSIADLLTANKVEYNKATKTTYEFSSSILKDNLKLIKELFN